MRCERKCEGDPSRRPAAAAHCLPLILHRPTPSAAAAATAQPKRRGCMMVRVRQLQAYMFVAVVIYEWRAERALKA